MILRDIKNIIFRHPLYLILIILFFLGMRGCLIFSFSLVPLVFFRKGINKYFDKGFILTLLFFFFYLSISFFHGLIEFSSVITLFIFPLTFYLLGRILVNSFFDNILGLFFIFVLSLTLLTVLSTFIDISANGFINPKRELVMFSYDEIIPATLIGSNVSLGLVCSSLILATIANKRERVYQFFFVLIGVVSIVPILHLMNRTGLVILAIAFLFVLFYNAKRYTLLQYLFLFIVLCIIVHFVISFIFEYHFLEIYLMREEGSDFKSAGGRTERWVDSLTFIYRYPLGGGIHSIGERVTAHNMWLDALQLSGVIPFTLLLYITFIFLKRVFYIIFKARKYSYFLCTLIGVFSIAFMLTCLVEPILEGSLVYTTSFFFFIGIINQLYYKSKID